MAKRKRGVYVGDELGPELEEHSQLSGQSVSRVARLWMRAGHDLVLKASNVSPGPVSAVSTAPAVPTGVTGKPPALVRVKAVPSVRRVRPPGVPVATAGVDSDVIALERDYWFLQALRHQQESLRSAERIEQLELAVSSLRPRLLVRPLPKVRLRHRR